ncbi:uncharacterized protein LOC110059307 [Orbicella faveolata]|uniref:uncharacterized protein LOC110059307 n=1 Tax=Orbicella faveolata TaxID=48498 RepID=UPI0009E5CDAB|nr:uncharacterized protein LOC110059307 [Orbicella faveolata]
MLQNQRKINKMLQSLAEFLMHVGVVWAICFVCTILLAFGIIYEWVSNANPGTQMGFGLGGCIFVIGFVFGPLGEIVGMAIGLLLGGFIGSVMYRHGEALSYQNPRSIEKMSESLLRFPMLWTSPDSIMGVVWTIIIVRLSMMVFEYLFWRVSLVNPGTLIGLGVAGCIGMLGFVVGLWDGIIGIAVCLWGSCIGSGTYRYEDGPRYQQNRESEKQMLAQVLRESNRSNRGSNKGSNGSNRGKKKLTVQSEPTDVNH